MLDVGFWVPMGLAVLWFGISMLITLKEWWNLIFPAGLLFAMFMAYVMCGWGAGI